MGSLPAMVLFRRLRIHCPMKIPITQATIKYIHDSKVFGNTSFSFSNSGLVKIS
jgi:hypothetical protein